MSYSCINRISVEKDDVYLSIKESNDTAPYSSHTVDCVTKAYERDGIRGVDEAMCILMADGGVALRGSHPSIMKYQALSRSDTFKDLCELRDNHFDGMTQEQAAACQKKLLSDLADLGEAYDKEHKKSKDRER